MVVALDLGSPPSQALIAQVIEKCRQKLSGGQQLFGGRESSVEIPREVLRRGVALVSGSPHEHYVHIAVSIGIPHCDG